MIKWSFWFFIANFEIPEIIKLIKRNVLNSQPINEIHLKYLIFEKPCALILLYSVGMLVLRALNALWPVFRY